MEKIYYSIEICTLDLETGKECNDTLFVHTFALNKESAILVAEQVPNFDCAIVCRNYGVIEISEMNEKGAEILKNTFLVSSERHLNLWK